MATIADKLSAIIGQKSDMVKNLNIKGVSSASDSEKFNTLVAKVLTVGGKNQYVKPGTGNTSSPTLNQKLGALYNQKNLLATYLTSMGVPASTSEKLNTLVPKILDIPMGGYLYMIDLFDTSERYASSIYLSTTTDPYRIIIDLWIDTLQKHGVKKINGEYKIGLADGVYDPIITSAFLSEITVWLFGENNIMPYIGSYSDCRLRNALRYIDFRNTSAVQIMNGAYNLETAILPKVQKVGGFNSCKISMIKASSAGTVLENFKALTGLNYIGEKAFANCKNLTNIKIAGYPTTIWSSAFENCINLECIGASFYTDISASATLYDFSYFDSSVTNIFKNCYNLKGYIYTTWTASIVSGMFYNCSKLYGMNLSYTKNIGSYAFYGCQNIRKFGNGLSEGILRLNGGPYAGGVKSIGSGAFALETSVGASNISSVYLRTGYIGNDAFRNRSGISIISGIAGSYIGSYAFCIDESIFGDYHPVTLIDNSFLPYSSCSIGSYAFYGRILNGSVFYYHCDWSVGAGAFQAMSSLPSITTSFSQSISVKLDLGVASSNYRIPKNMFKGQYITTVCATYLHHSDALYIGDDALNTYSGILDLDWFGSIVTIGHRGVRLHSLATEFPKITDLTYLYSDSIIPNHRYGQGNYDINGRYLTYPSQSDIAKCLIEYYGSYLAAGKHILLRENMYTRMREYYSNSSYLMNKVSKTIF